MASRASGQAGRPRALRRTRPDDPNDLVPHEDRRELRAYGVFAAWLNHVDAKAINSLDMLVTENGRSFVRHYLVDFGSALGSGGVGPADYWAGPSISSSRATSRSRSSASASPGRSGARAVLRSALHRPAAATQRPFQSGALEATRAQPGVPACAGR